MKLEIYNKTIEIPDEEIQAIFQKYMDKTIEKEKSEVKWEFKSKNEFITLYSSDHNINKLRRNGGTTQDINNIIEYLFQGYKVYFSQPKKFKNFSKLLIDKIKSRLHREHPSFMSNYRLNVNINSSESIDFAFVKK